MRVAETAVSGPFASGVSQPGVKAASFVSADGSKLVVHLAAVQEADAELELRLGKPFERSRYQQWRTSRDEDLARLPTGVVSAGRFRTRLPGRGLLTLRFQR